MTIIHKHSTAATTTSTTPQQADPLRRYGIHADYTPTQEEIEYYLDNYKHMGRDKMKKLLDVPWGRYEKIKDVAKAQGNRMPHIYTDAELQLLIHNNGERSIRQLATLFGATESSVSSKIHELRKKGHTIILPSRGRKKGSTTHRDGYAPVVNNKNPEKILIKDTQYQGRKYYKLNDKTYVYPKSKKGLEKLLAYEQERRDIIGIDQ